MVDMSFKVEREFRQDFKRRAAELGISMKTLLEEAYELHCALSSVRLSRVDDLRPREGINEAS